MSEHCGPGLVLPLPCKKKPRETGTLLTHRAVGESGGLVFAKAPCEP